MRAGVVSATTLKCSAVHGEDSQRCPRVGTRGGVASRTDRKAGRRSCGDPQARAENFLARIHCKLEAYVKACTVFKQVRHIPWFRKTASPAEKPRRKAGGATAQDCRWSTVIAAFYSERAPLMPQRSTRDAKTWADGRPITVCTENRCGAGEDVALVAETVGSTSRDDPFLWWAVLSTLP